MARPPHSCLACPPSEAAEPIAVVCDCWLFTPRQRRNRMKRGKSRLITAKNNIDRSGPTCRPQSATFYSLIIARNIGRRLRAAYNAAFEDALRERSNFKTGERSRSHALRRERKPGGGAKVRYTRSAYVVLYCGILPTGSFSCHLSQQILAALGVTTGDRVKLVAFP